MPQVLPSFAHRLQYRQFEQALQGSAPVHVAAWRTASPTVIHPDDSAAANATAIQALRVIFMVVHPFS
ncbi:MAG: hypothetical protein WC815_04820 [Vicinamibacterales bacterium]